MADISEGVDTIKDNWEFDDEMSEEKDTMDDNKGKTEESADDEEEDTMDGNKETIEAHDTTDNPETDGYSSFGVGGNRNENQKDRTNIITGSSIELIEKEEHGRASLVTKPVLNILDESSDDDDDDNEDKDDNDDNIDDDGVDYSDMLGMQENYEPIIV